MLFKPVRNGFHPRYKKEKKRVTLTLKGVVAWTKLFLAVLFVEFLGSEVGSWSAMV